MLRIANYSSQGGRNYNEDSIEIYTSGDRCCAVLADGLGGQGGGKIASEAAARMIVHAGSQLNCFSEESIVDIYRQANEAVLCRQTSDCQMQTTAVSLFLDQGTAVWAHIGDSRLYHFIDGTMASMTMDHSVSQLAVYTGEITQQQVRFHPSRNKVLRALGAQEDVSPSIASADLTDGAFHAFLLCSDGFWEYVLEGEMEIDLAKAEYPKEWIQYMLERLQSRVNGENDNLSVIALF